jgi:hypothetical protein
VAVDRIRDESLADLFARALVAIARADHQLGMEEGMRLQERITLRTGSPVELDDLLLAPALLPSQLADALGAFGGPFRSASGLHPGEVAAMLVSDGASVALAKGYISEAEGRLIVAFGLALGCSLDEIRAMSGPMAPWLADAFGA